MNLTVTGQQGMLVSSGPLVTLRDSVVRGTEFGVLVTNLVTAADFVATRLLDGELTCPAGVCRCVAAYDGDLRRLDPDCRLPPGRRPF